MTREEFLTLPPALALGIIWDAITMGMPLEQMPMPKVPLPPKYDMRVYRKDGYCWASEMDLGSLQYWQQKAAESALGDGPYAEKDTKKAKQLSYWIAWRAVYQSNEWHGMRGKDHIHAQAPSRYPTIVWTDKSAQSQQQQSPTVDESNGIPF